MIKVQQLVGLDVQRFGEPSDVPQTHIAFAAFNTADIAPVQADDQGKMLLTPSVRVTQGSDSLAERDKNRLSIHLTHCRG